MKCGALRNKLLEGTAAESALVKDAFVACREVALVDPCPSFISPKGSEGQGQRDALCDMDLAVPLESLRSVSSSTCEIDGVKVEYLDRYTSVVFLGCKLATLGKDIPLNFDMHIRFAHMTASLAEFFQAVSDRFSLMEKDSDFKPKFEDGKKLLDWCHKVSAAARVEYANALSAIAEEMKTQCPPEGVIANCKLLTDKALQNSLFSNPARNKLNPGVQALNITLQSLKTVRGRSLPRFERLRLLRPMCSLPVPVRWRETWASKAVDSPGTSEWIAVAAKASTSGFKLQKELKQAYNDAMDVRARAKTAIMTDWILDNILNDKKTTPDEIKKQAGDITEMILRTNPVLPQYLTQLVDAMAGKIQPPAGEPPAVAAPAASSASGAAA